MRKVVGAPVEGVSTSARAHQQSTAHRKMRDVHRHLERGGVSCADTLGRDSTQARRMQPVAARQQPRDAASQRLGASDTALAGMIVHDDAVAEQL